MIVAPGPAPLVERAPAKINLSLRVLGRRPDGYHELESLVAFAAPLSAPLTPDAQAAPAPASACAHDCAADLVTLLPGPDFGLAIEGPAAASLDDGSENLIARAVRGALALNVGLAVGSFRLAKRLPVAAGLGGGSADAAAALRLLRRLNGPLAPAVGWHQLAASLGADVPACLESRFALMAGIGERLAFLGALAPLWVVLANPRVPLATGPVFKALAAPPLAPTPASPSPVGKPTAQGPSRPGDAGALLAWLAATANDLEAPAIRLCPVVADVLADLAALPGARLTRMSGSGPTCFALFTAADDCRAAAIRLARRRPGWWVCPARLA